MAELARAAGAVWIARTAWQRLADPATADLPAGAGSAGVARRAVGREATRSGIGGTVAAAEAFLALRWLAADSTGLETWCQAKVLAAQIGLALSGHAALLISRVGIVLACTLVPAAAKADEWVFAAALLAQVRAQTATRGGLWRAGSWQAHSRVAQLTGAAGAIRVTRTARQRLADSAAAQLAAGADSARVVWRAVGGEATRLCCAVTAALARLTIWRQTTNRACFETRCQAELCTAQPGETLSRVAAFTGRATTRRCLRRAGCRLAYSRVADLTGAARAIGAAWSAG